MDDVGLLMSASHFTGGAIYDFLFLSKPSLGKGTAWSSACGTLVVPSHKVEFPSSLPYNDLSHPQHDMPHGYGIVMMAVPLSILASSIELISQWVKSLVTV